MMAQKLKLMKKNAAMRYLLDAVMFRERNKNRQLNTDPTAPALLEGIGKTMLNKFGANRMAQANEYLKAMSSGERRVLALGLDGAEKILKRHKVEGLDLPAMLK